MLFHLLDKVDSWNTNALMSMYELHAVENWHLSFGLIGDQGR
jgi:hypothetical protein